MPEIIEFLSRDEKVTLSVRLDVQQVFSGQWTFMRSISTPAILMRGYAAFFPFATNVCKYEEHGTYDFNGLTHDFYQHRLFVFSEKHVCIYKSDHTLLHVFDLQKNQELPVLMHHTHQCRDDIYRCHIKVCNMNQFYMVYSGFGLAKNYQIHTSFLRKAL